MNEQRTLEKLKELGKLSARVREGWGFGGESFLADEIELLEVLVLEHGHLPHCPQFTGPYDLGELEPACICGRDVLEAECNE